MKGRFRMLGWAIVLVIFFFIFRTIAGQWQEVSSHAWAFDTWILAGAFGVQFIEFLLVFFLWVILLQMLDVRCNPFNAAKIYFHSSLARYLPGNLWQVVGAATLGRCYGYSALQFGIASLYLPLLMIVSGLFLAIGGLFILDLGTLIGPAAKYLGIASAVGILAFFWPPVHGFFWRLLNRMFRTDYPAPDLGFCRIALVFPILLANWILQAWAFFLFIQSFYPLPGTAFLPMVVFVAVSTTAGQLVFFVPAGIGIREGLFLLLFPKLMPLEVAAAASVGSRIWYTVADVATIVLISAILFLLGKAGRAKPDTTPAEQ